MATAASTALPPLRSTSIPAADASGSTLATAPPYPTATGDLGGAGRPAVDGAEAAGATAPTDATTARTANSDVFRPTERRIRTSSQRISRRRVVAGGPDRQDRLERSPADPGAAPAPHVGRRRRPRSAKPRASPPPGPAPTGRSVAPPRPRPLCYPASGRSFALTTFPPALRGSAGSSTRSLGVLYEASRPPRNAVSWSSDRVAPGATAA